MRVGLASAPRLRNASGEVIPHLTAHCRDRGGELARQPTTGHPVAIKKPQASMRLAPIAPAKPARAQSFMLRPKGFASGLVLRGGQTLRQSAISTDSRAVVNERQAISECLCQGRCVRDHRRTCAQLCGSPKADPKQCGRHHFIHDAWGACVRRRLSYTATHAPPSANPTNIQSITGWIEASRAQRIC